MFQGKLYKNNESSRDQLQCKQYFECLGANKAKERKKLMKLPRDFFKFNL